MFFCLGQCSEGDEARRCCPASAESNGITVGQVESWLQWRGNSPPEQTTKTKLAELLQVMLRQIDEEFRGRFRQMNYQTHSDENTCRDCFATRLYGMHARDFCIVVAEDDALLRYCTVKILRDEGFRVLEAADGQQALELVEKCKDAVHLLITDYNMPRMNGAELARRLKKKHEKLMVLLISGEAHGLAGTSDFEVLPKPYNGFLLTTKVRELLFHPAMG